MRSRGYTMLAALMAALCVAACSSADANPPNWVPKPSFQGDGGGGGTGGSAVPGLPTPSAPSSSPGSGGSQTPGAPSPTPAEDPNVLAKGLASPVGLAMMPDGTAIVGERASGRILQVQPKPDQPVTVVKTLTGLDASGDGGLLDLALSPTYAEDRLIYAYITTPTDNRVVDFTMGGTPAPVLTGIPKGKTGNTGRLLFGIDGNLYIGTGDAGQPSLAANPTSLAGKVLLVNPVGAPVRAGRPVFTSGHHEVDGLCQSSTGPIFEAETNPAAPAKDEINVLAAGANYGWPAPRATSIAAAATAPAAKGDFGGCAVIGAQLYVTSRDGTDLLGAGLTATSSSTATSTVGALVSEQLTKYGRLRTVVAATDGALWLTTSNRDGEGAPVPADDRVIRIVPQLGGADSPV
ncbi:glucose/arabinose dehydrogenase [Jatrophihabitans sp. GAS493]|uniref:PQQ-dependent sugar dehydrogenase n=1 Tax=Jatrophihabitans sp. GAS493 TaxID=1907575 RepID=UPI000BC09E9E|nr:PQQ-dependent sugar dehydrogenase [Jatrophihabitans sp. GAS493]SOD73378.1 glucose/arabinose dehydrogenase [Jatrophihabitans sp. GAS493]